MYKIDGKYKYACQMCHDAFANVEMCQIANEPGLGLDAMNLCLCPNCAREYKKMRADSDEAERFLNSIAELEESEINEADPVEVDFDGEPLWFTQSHIAEIRELMALQDEAESYSENSSKKLDTRSHREAEDTATSEEEPVKAGTAVYKEYVGKRVYHKGHKSHGTVISCDGTYIEVHFEDGNRAGKNVRFSLQMCLEKGLLQLV